MSVRLTTRLLCLALLVFGFSFTAMDASAQRGPKVRKPRPVLTSPAPGTVVHPGDTVTVKWEYEGDLSQLDRNWCEQELYFSLDGGQSLGLRITPQMGIDARSFVWTVPDIETSHGVFDIQYGCEVDNFPHEVINIQTQSRLIIQPAAGRGAIEQIRLTSVPEKLKAGDVATIGWSSSLKDASSYEVQVSYNRGGEFTTLGTTTGNTYSWTVPADYKGSLLFRIVAANGEGRTFDSGMWLKDIIKVSR